jgi:hypothetical protein
MMRLLRHWQSLFPLQVMVCGIFTEDAFLIDSIEWVKIPILPTAQQIICRASSRLFVGTPLCAQLFFGLLLATFVDVSKARIVIIRK